MSTKVDRFIPENLPEANGRSQRMSLGATEIGLVEYNITGPEVRVLYRLARVIENEMGRIKGTVGGGVKQVEGRAENFF